MHTETKAMICTAAVLIAMGIFKDLAALCLITAMIYEEGVRNLINKKEKSAHGAATPLGTQLNRQANYNTDQKKSEIRKLAVEILNLSLQLQENADGRIVWRGKINRVLIFDITEQLVDLPLNIGKMGLM